MPKRMPERIDFSIVTSAFALVLLARSERGVCAILLGDTADELCADLQRRFPKAQLVENKHGLAARLKVVTDFLAAPLTPLDFPLDIHGSDFQKSVWAVLQTIPVGQTLSYSEVAERLGKPKAARAVANACAANPLALVIPCHRILRADGGISGYRWGVERKRALLAQESRAAHTQ
ncbi:MAG TPA: methylated-DNA--[protein]-cysteine S-methyltransferase [Thiopseudomonas sp.]|nr:methylated-DNA--[protein]-cysteine S-methyltransferase [Thiopseudomonas sp.]